MMALAAFTSTALCIGGIGFLLGVWWADRQDERARLIIVQPRSLPEPQRLRLIRGGVFYDQDRQPVA